MNLDIVRDAPGTRRIRRANVEGHHAARAEDRDAQTEHPLLLCSLVELHDEVGVAGEADLRGVVAPVLEVEFGLTVLAHTRQTQARIDGVRLAEVILDDLFGDVPAVIVHRAFSSWM